MITELQNEIEVTRNLLRLVFEARKEPVDGNVSHFAPSFKICQFTSGYLANLNDKEVVTEIKERLINLDYWK